MLTDNQKGYLNTVPKDKVAHVLVFDPASQITAQKIFERKKI